MTYRFKLQALAAFALAVSILVGVPAAATAGSQACPGFEGASITGHVQGPNIREASGLAASRSQPGVYWTHNDSGGTNRVYALDAEGATLSSFRFGTVNVADLEDIAIGPGPIAGRDYIYAADIGDNGRQRSFVRIYRFPEPSIPGNSQDVQLPDSDVETFHYTYENPAAGGTWSRDSEGFAVDPVSGDLVIFEKELGTWNGVTRAGWVYRIKQKDLVEGPTLTAKAMVSIRMRYELQTVGPVTAADISADGSVIFAKNGYEVFAWLRSAGQSVFEAMAAHRVSTCVWEGSSGEALTIEANGSGVMMTPEGSHRPLTRLAINVPGSPPPPPPGDRATCNYLDATIVGTDGDDVIIGTEGRDVIVGLGGNDVIKGRGGNDVICGGPGKDILRGNAGSDMLRGGNGKDRLYGGGGYDTLVGGNGKDTIRGARNNDTLKGGPGDDALFGGAGVDALFGGSGDDDCAGGGGRVKSC